MLSGTCPSDAVSWSDVFWQSAYFYVTNAPRKHNQNCKYTHIKSAGGSVGDAAKRCGQQVNAQELV